MLCKYNLYMYCLCKSKSSPLLLLCFRSPSRLGSFPLLIVWCRRNPPLTTLHEWRTVKDPKCVRNDATQPETAAVGCLKMLYHHTRWCISNAPDTGTRSLMMPVFVWEDNGCVTCDAVRYTVTEAVFTVDVNKYLETSPLSSVR